jgi:hypothetical protein
MNKKIIIAVAVTAIIAGSAIAYAEGTVTENTYQPAPITTQSPSDKESNIYLSGRQALNRTEQKPDNIEQKFYSTPDIPSPEEVIAATPKEGIPKDGKFLTPDPTDPTKPGKYIEYK